MLQRRRLYPPELFERARLFGVDVPRPRHPELLDYVASALRSLRPSLRDGTAHSLSLLVTAPTDGAVLERHVFSLGFPVAATAPPPAASSLSLGGLAELERQLAGLLVRHALVDVSLPRLPDGARARASPQPLSHKSPDCSFRLVVETEARMGADEEPAWILEGQVARGEEAAVGDALSQPVVSLSEDALREHGLPPLLHLEVSYEQCRRAA